jgi:methyl-accepting chemotaxis protein
MNELSIKTKLILLLAIPMASLMLIALMAINTFHNINEGIGRIYDDRIVPMKQLKTIADDYAVLVIDAINKADNNIISSAEAINHIQTAQNRITGTWEKYLTTELTKEENTLVSDIKPLFVNADQAIKAALQALRSSDNNQTKGALSNFNGPLYKHIDPISAKITELLDLQLRVAAEERDIAEEKYLRSRNIFLFIVIAVIISISFAGYKSVTYISTQINHLKDAIEITERNSDLSIQIKFAHADELGQLAKAYSGMMLKFRKVIEQVRLSSLQLKEESNTLNLITQRTAENSHRQEGDTNQAATATTEMSASIEEVARNAQEASNSANKANDEARKSHRLMVEAMTQFDALSNKMDDTGVKIQQLSEDSNAIGRVVDVIKSIAEQTNLLALNAAIEAARAGEQGRGFAVVADEVRSLAKRTQDSTLEIQGMIERLQHATSEAVSSTDQVKGNLQKTKDNSSLATQSLKNIQQAITMISDMNLQIATATEEQSQVSQEINRNIVSIAQASKESVTASHKITSSSQELAKMSKGMETMVACFKI